MSNEEKKTYTHYTDKKGFQGITKSGTIKASTDTVNDAVFGPGAYTTTKDPAKSNANDVAKNNYDGSTSFHQGMKKEGRVDYAIKYADPTSTHTKVDPYQTQGRDVHMHPGDVDLRKMENVEYYKRDKHDNYKQIKK